jgi:uncharacterized protein YndB with AHSA1/START domain
MTAPARSGDPAIDDDAPVISSAEAEIDAPIEAVWSILTAIERWPAWNPDVKAASLDGPAVEGATFRWKAGPSTINSTVVRLDAPRLIAWTGRTLGIRAVHVWRLQSKNGRTLARTEESYEGFVARILRRPLQKMLDRTLTDGVHHLKVEAERSRRRPESGPIAGSSAR